MAPDRGPAVSAVTIIVTVLATIFVAARFYTRALLVRSIKQDDWWILAAWLCAVGFSTSICVAVRYGLGKHKDEIPDNSFDALSKAQYAFDILYNPSLMLTKTSIVVFFLSVMSKDVDPIFKWCNYLTLAVVNIAGVALTCLNIFQCRPVAAGYGYPRPTSASCTDIVTLYLSSAPVNIITDIAILLLPFPILTGMRLPRKQKIILVTTFSFGAFVAVVDVVRIAYLQQAAQNRFRFAKGNGGDPGKIVQDSDFSWYASLSFMWSAVEVCLGIICACVPSLKPLFARFLPTFIRDASDPATSNDSIDLGKPDGLPASHVLPKGDVSMVNNPAAFRKSVSKEYSGDDEGDQMGFLNMLSSPPPDENPPGSSLSMSRTNTKLSRRATNKSAVSDFGFVKMSGRRNMLRLTNRQSAWPVAVVTVIFFLWGFAYGMLDALNNRFQVVAQISSGKALGLHAAYYGGYVFGPLTLGRYMLKKYSWKAPMIAGLSIYGCGTLVFWPSAVLVSYPAFIVSNFIVGFGLSCLEVAANPYIALCGPLEYAEVRLNLSQAFQAIGTVCSPLLATKVLFRRVNNASSLTNVQWAYLGISLFVFALAIVFYYIPLPEASDEQLEDQADERCDAYEAKVGPWKVVYVTLLLGVFSQWCYVGLQESVGSNLEPLIKALNPDTTLTPFDFLTVAHTIFALGRFLTAFLNYLFKPRWILLGSYIGLIICLALNMHLGGDAGGALAILTIFFEAGIFSIVFAISMRGLGKHTKTGASIMTGAISGGAIFGPIQWAVSNGRGVRYSYSVPLAVSVFGALFAVYLNVMPQARLQVDPIHESRARRRAKSAARQASTASGAKREEQAQQFGLTGIVARRQKAKRAEKKALHSASPSVQHVERQSMASLDSSVQSPVLTMDFADQDNPLATPNLVRMKPSRGHIADLALWPVEEDTSESRSSESGSNGSRSRPDVVLRSDEHLSGNDSADAPGSSASQHRSARHDRGQDEEGLDDYHAFMRKI